MAKLLLFSDLHIFAHKGSQKRLQDCFDVLNWVLSTARQKNITNVLFAGDLFHDRQRISVYSYHQTYKIISQYPDVNLWLLLGNHDLWYYEKKDISSVIPIGALNHVTVIDEFKTINIQGLDIDFLPFTHDPAKAIPEIKSPVLISHIAVDGAKLNFHHNTVSEVSIESDNDMHIVGPDIFDGYERVFLGHYHGAQKLTDKAEYIGSTLQLNFNEADQKKHIIIFDTETLETEYIENTFSPKHLIIQANEISNYDLDNNFVRINVDDINQSDIVELRNEIIKIFPNAQLAFVHKKKDEKIEKLTLEGDTLERYVKSVGCKNLDEQVLLSIGKDICLQCT